MSTFAPLVGAKRTSISARRFIFAPFYNGPGDVKPPRVIVTPPSSRFCPWLALTMLLEGTVSLSGYAWFIG
jgi:hypothetical protein